MSLDTIRDIRKTYYKSKADVNIVGSSVVPVPPSVTKKFRELSEDFWSIQQPTSPQFAETETIPLVAPTGELTDEGVYSTFMTEAVNVAVDDLLSRIEINFQLNGVFGKMLRCVLIRVKAGKQIYPHIDDTFLGTEHEIYRMQMVSSSDKPFWNYASIDLGWEINESPTVNEMVRIPPRALQSEANIGLNDNIHALVYFQRNSATDELQKLTLHSP